MKKKPEPKKSKEERERRALHDAILGRLSEMRECLKGRYALTKHIDEQGVIHGLNLGIHDIEMICRDILDPNYSAKEVKELNNDRLERRVLPVCY